MECTLEHGWELHVDERTGARYRWNKLTGESRWIQPGEGGGVVESAARAEKGGATAAAVAPARPCDDGAAAGREAELEREVARVAAEEVVAAQDQCVLLQQMKDRCIQEYDAETITETEGKF